MQRQDLYALFTDTDESTPSQPSRRVSKRKLAVLLVVFVCVYLAINKSLKSTVSNQEADSQAAEGARIVHYGGILVGIPEEPNYESHISLDRHVYMPGDPVHIRVVTLTSLSHLSPVRQPSAAQVTITSSTFIRVHSFALNNTEDSSISFGTWEIPATLSGGEYTIDCSISIQDSPGESPSHDLRFFHPTTATTSQRKFEVRHYRDQRVLLVDIELDKAGYGPGELVRGKIVVTRADGGNFATQARVQPELVVASSALPVVFSPNPLVLLPTTPSSPQLSSLFDFVLPDAQAFRGSEDVFVHMVVDHDSVIETASQPIPLSLGTVKVSFFPEGGHLVAGVSSGLYFEARSNRDQPLQSFAGHIVEDESTVVANVQSVFDGRGFVRFVPKENHKYTLLVTQPKGVNQPIPIFPSETSAVQLRSFATHGAMAVQLSTGSQTTPSSPSQLAVFQPSDDISINICTPAELAEQSFNVSVYRRNFKLASVTLEPQTINSSVACASTAIPVRTLDRPAVDSHGVLRVSVETSANELAAERLVFRYPHGRLDVAVEVQPSVALLPGAAVSLAIRVTDSITGTAVPYARVGLHVTDAVTLDMVEARLKPPRLPVMVLLENNVDELVYSDSILQSPTAVGLMLGTQPPLIRFQPIMPWWRGVVFDSQPAANEMVPLSFASQAVSDSVSPRISTQAHIDRTRSDFTKTIFWRPLLITDSSGDLLVRFQLGDMLTKFRVVVDAHSANSPTFGSFEGAEISSSLPFSLIAKVPPVVTEGDVMQIPVEFSSSADTPLHVEACDVTSQGDLVVSPHTASLDPNVQILIAPQGHTRHYITCTAHLDDSSVTNATTRSLINLKAVASAPSSLQAPAATFVDHVVQSVKVVPRGFPIDLGHVSGMLTSALSHSNLVISLPPTAKPERVQVTATLFPSSVATLAQALEGLIQEPYGCFEQTSATVYPLIMAQQYFTTHTPPDTLAIERTNQMLQKGFDRLVSFEVTGGGFEWFGHAPAHEALTAYGLVELLDMQRVFPVPQALIDRTKAWLLSRKDDSTAGFLFDPRSLDTFGGAPLGTSCAYLVWALTNAGITEGLESQLAKLLDIAKSSSDSYVIALGALAAYGNGHQDSAAGLVDKLVLSQDPQTGVIKGALTSITRSLGSSLDIETTSLAVLAMLHEPAHLQPTVQALAFLTSQIKDGKFGSTQSTILALKAILAFDKMQSKQSSRNVMVSLLLDGSVVETASFLTGQDSPVVLGSHVDTVTAVRTAFADQLPHTLGIAVEPATSQTEDEDIRILFSMQATTQADTPPNTDTLSFPLVLATSVLSASVAEGDAVPVSVSVSVNPAWLTAHAEKAACHSGALPMSVVVVGIPAGLDIVHSKVKELVKSHDIDMYELVDNFIVLYWRSFDRTWVGERSKQLVIHTVATVPGSFLGPASYAYLYYGSEFKHWVDGLHVVVQARSS